MHVYPRQCISAAVHANICQVQLLALRTKCTHLLLPLPHVPAQIHAKAAKPTSKRGHGIIAIRIFVPTANTTHIDGCGAVWLGFNHVLQRGLPIGRRPNFTVNGGGHVRQVLSIKLQLAATTPSETLDGADPVRASVAIAFSIVKTCAIHSTSGVKLHRGLTVGLPPLFQITASVPRFIARYACTKEHASKVKPPILNRTRGIQRQNAVGQRWRYRQIFVAHQI